MSEFKKVKLQVIPADAVVNIDISGHFYKRITAVYFNFVSNIETATFEKIVQHLEKDELDKLTTNERNNAIYLRTLLTLMHTIENKFTEANLDVEKEFKIPIED